VKDFIEKGRLKFMLVLLTCIVCIVIFMYLYFVAYGRSYMMGEVITLSEEGWTHRIVQPDAGEQVTMRRGFQLSDGETLITSRQLDIDMPEAAILIRANHQAVNVFLDDTPLLISAIPIGQNPGMAMHFITLPYDYYGRTLKIEWFSPYYVYSGRTTPVFMGSHTALHAFTFSATMRVVILMGMCLLVGFGIIALTLIQALKGLIYPQNLAIGVFAVSWAFYIVSIDAISVQFLPPIMASNYTLGLYAFFQAPLSLFFYFSSKRYKKWMLPAVILHCGYPIVAISLQLLGIVDFAQLLFFNTRFFIGFIYILILVVLDAIKGDSLSRVVALIFSIACISMIYDFLTGLTWVDTEFYFYRYVYFALIMCVLIHNISVFFRTYYRQAQEGEVLTLQNRLAKDSYENIKMHLHQVGELKHEMAKHLAAMRTYLKDGRYNEAEQYLSEVGAKADVVTEAVHHNNFLINAVVHNLLFMARERNVAVHLNLNLNAEPIGISDPDLYSLLNNILDNALEACEAIPESHERLIRFSLSRQEPYFLITCTNSRIKDAFLKSENGGGLETTKKESGHGYGMLIIERIADTYDGLVDTYYDEDTFKTKVALKGKKEING